MILPILVLQMLALYVALKPVNESYALIALVFGLLGMGATVGILDTLGGVIWYLLVARTFFRLGWDKPEGCGPTRRVSFPPWWTRPAFSHIGFSKLG